MENKKPLRQIAWFLCTLVFVGVLFGVIYVMSAFLRPYDTGPGPTTEATTEVTTSATTGETTEATTGETTEATTGETTEATVPAVKMPDLELYASHSFLYIPETGEFIMLKGKADDRIYPASLTKLFSAYVALMHMDIRAKVKVGSELTLIPEDSSIAGLTQGEVLTVQTLVEAMMLPSGNDAATVLAVAAGRVLAKDADLEYRSALARFVEEMNTQAKALGLTDTRFANADGYHRADHYTTCRDMQKIGQLALSNLVIRRAVGTPEKFVDLENDAVQSWKNTNLLLQTDSEYYNPYALGLKTGYTRAAGYCLMSAFDVDGREFMVGVFGCPDMMDRFADTVEIFSAYVGQ